jgi:hypothetical protein
MAEVSSGVDGEIRQSPIFFLPQFTDGRLMVLSAEGVSGSEGAPKKEMRGSEEMG